MARVFIICLAAIVIVTTLVCISNPKMHKRAVILNYKYKVVDVVEPTETQVNVSPQVPVVQTQNIQPAVQPQLTPVQMTTEAPVKVQTVQTQPAKQSVKTVATPVVQQQTVKTTSVSQPAKTVQTTPVQTTTAKTVQTTPAKTTSTQTKQTVKQQTVTQQPKQTAKPVLTAQQETILWNTWRSNLQNHIMDSVPSLPLPQGTKFNFSFNVDKNGKITNVKTWADDSKYNPYALQYITPVIRGLQGKSILTFPDGSNRDSVLFEGNMRISNTSKYSTAGDYNDVEKITR